MRELKGRIGTAVAIWAVAATLFQLWTSGFGFFEPRTQRSYHLLFLLPIAFLYFRADAKRSPADHPSPLDWLLAFLSLLPNLYSIWEANRINLRFENVDALTPGEWAMGILATLLVLEALRRAVTPVMAGLVSIGIFYLFTTEYMPGLLHYRDMSLSEIVESMYLLNGMGMYGAITGISSTMVAVFIIFGAFIELSGVGRLFHNLGTKVAGKQSGGPAKVEVISSALFGTISGSSTANVFATGSFTIPAMIKLGYRPHFAAGVEASSSVGGQIMPPVMGAGAFVMAEITNIPYSQIVIAAILGSVCYFLMIMVSVHFEAKRLALKGVDPSEIPSWSEILKDLHLLLPVVILMTMLMVDYSAHYSAFWATLSVVACSWLRKDTRLYPRDIWRMMANGGRNMAIVALACAGAGMFVACLTVTGVVISISTLITSVSGGNLMIAGAMLMVTTLILGMGVPTTAAYVIGAAIGAPLLIGMGVPVLAAHMFVFYFSILADATPPVSVASYAAASIARADPMKTGLVAARLAIAGFVVGFNYLYTPALLMQGPVIDIIAELLVNMLGLTLMAAAMSGFFTGPIALPWRLPLGVFGLGIVLLETMPVWPRVGMEALAMLALHLLRGSIGGRQAAAAARP
ncbi:MAG: TRAP transporter permease [Alphaproteobacteria bacterium]|nr:TRAP transporter permease [Alphaproteobacteria bacterium]